jgi:hypothetical protein
MVPIKVLRRNPLICGNMSMKLKVLMSRMWINSLLYIFDMPVSSNDVISLALFIFILVIGVVYGNVLIYDHIGIKLKIIKGRVLETYLHYI